MVCWISGQLTAQGFTSMDFWIIRKYFIDSVKAFVTEKLLNVYLQQNLETFFTETTGKWRFVCFFVDLEWIWSLTVSSVSLIKDSLMHILRVIKHSTKKNIFCLKGNFYFRQTRKKNINILSHSWTQKEGAHPGGVQT